MCTSYANLTQTTADSSGVGGGLRRWLATPLPPLIKQINIAKPDFSASAGSQDPRCKSLRTSFGNPYKGIHLWGSLYMEIPI